MKFKCEACGHDNEIDATTAAAAFGSLGGSATSRRKARAARANAKLGGWPKGKKRGPRDANQLAHGIVAEAIKRTER